METAPFGAVKASDYDMVAEITVTAAMETAPFGAVKAKSAMLTTAGDVGPQWRPLLSER